MVVSTYEVWPFKQVETLKLFQIAAAHADQIRHLLDVNHIVGVLVREGHIRVLGGTGRAPKLLEVFLDVFNGHLLETFVAHW